MASEATGISGIAERYATALYELADEQKALDEVAADLKELMAMLAASDDLRRLVRSFLIAREDQGRAMAEVMEKAELSDLTRRFVGLITRNRRLYTLDAACRAYLRMLAARRGEVTAEVTAAAELTEAQIAAIGEALRKSEGRKISVELKVDPALLGGLVVRVGSRMVDSSIRSKIERLELAMKGAG